MMVAASAAVALRQPDDVMRLERLGSLHQSRLSFMRMLIRRLAREQWRTTTTLFDINVDGVGRAVYTIQGPQRAYSLVAFTHNIPDDLRSDRVIANAWDATFCLHDGIPDADDLTRLEQNVPLQEGGRISQKELCLSRANRSVRLWSHVLESLAAGEQPELEKIKAVGYLMRTTAVYGSGKFGAIDRDDLCDRAELQAPFQAEMLTVFLIRHFVRDMIQQMAQFKGGNTAVELAPEIARTLGIGNSTGLGMAPFIVNHPVLFNNWIAAREEAIARVRSIDNALEPDTAIFLEVFRLATISTDNWTSEHPIQIKRLAQLRADLKVTKTYLSEFDWTINKPWNRLVDWANTALSMEGQELLNSLILEPYGELIDSLESSMSDDNTDAFLIDGSVSVGQTRQIIEANFDWAIGLDWSLREHSERLWYVSEEKLEPRLGDRFEESLDDFEQPLAPARAASAAHKALSLWDEDKRISDFLAAHPEHRHTVRRAQISQQAVYSEIRDNTIAAKLLPIDMLRAKLSFFGASHFDPRSDRWVRIAMFMGAPYPEDLQQTQDDRWAYTGVR